MAAGQAVRPEVSQMASGGARARSGPAPDPNALRRDRDSKDWVLLPAAGRRGKPPAWPLSKANQRELELWTDEWKRPQAVEWKKLRLQVEVAIYVRTLVAAEKRNAPTSMRTLLRQQQESLGLSTSGLARNRWRIEEADAEDSTRAKRSARTPARERFTVVNGGKS